MHISIKMLLFSFALVTFLGGLTYALTLQKEVSIAIDSMYKNRTQVDRSMIAGSNIPPDYVVSGQEVLQSIYHIKDIGADIVIDGEIFSKELLIEEISVAHLDLTKNYKPTLERNHKGQIIKVIYNSW